MTDQELQEARKIISHDEGIGRRALDCALELLAEVDRLKDEKETWGNEFAIKFILSEQIESLRRDREELIKVLSSILVKEVDGRDFEDLMNETLEVLQHKYGGFKNSCAINMVLEFRESAREVLSRIQGEEGEKT